MDKKNLLIGVLEVFEENERLTRLIAKMAKEKNGEFGDLEETGRKALFDEAKSYSLEMDCTFPVWKRDGEQLAFPEWLDTLTWDAFYTRSCKELLNHPLKEVIRYFIVELEGVYQKKLAKLKEGEKPQKGRGQ